MTNRIIGLALTTASALLLFMTPVRAEVNRSPIVTKQNYTPAQVQQVLAKYGVNPLAPSVVSCAVYDPTGATTTQVTPWNIGGGAYSFEYFSGGVSSTQVDFIAIPLFSGSPNVNQLQTFAPGGDTDIETPFSIPFWGSDLTSGPWALVVVNSSGNSSVCYFDVLP